MDLAIFVVALLVVGDGGWWFIPCCFMYSGLGDFCLCLIAVCHHTYLVVASSSFVLI